MAYMNRRRFLCAALGAGGAGIAAHWNSIARGPAGADAANAAGVSLHEIVRTSRALGTEVSITALHADAHLAERAIAAAFAEIDRVEDVLSLYRPDSQVCRLNREGVLDSPHAYLLQVLQAASDLSRRSNRAFDVTVQPLWSLYAAASKAGRLPTEDEIAAARSLVNPWRMVIGDDRIALSTGTTITLNGIAQGFATDRAIAVLRAHGVEHALVNAGELGPVGTRPEGVPWTVGIQHPRQEDAWVALAKLDGRCLATSGDYATTFSDDRAYNHIFDPRTGRSPEIFSSVSVVAQTGMEADGLSTALFVTGLERGLELIRAMPGADALFVFKDGRVVQTEGFPEKMS